MRRIQGVVQYVGWGRSSTWTGLCVSALIYLPNEVLKSLSFLSLFFITPTGTCNNMKWATCEETPCQCTLQFAKTYKQPIDCTKCEFSFVFALKVGNYCFIGNFCTFTKMFLK